MSLAMKAQILTHKLLTRDRKSELLKKSQTRFPSSTHFAFSFFLDTLMKEEREHHRAGPRWKKLAGQF